MTAADASTRSNGCWRSRGTVLAIPGDLVRVVSARACLSLGVHSVVCMSLIVEETQGVCVRGGPAGAGGAVVGAEEFEGLPLERLEAELIGWAGHLAAATALWLRWLAVYDRREGWSEWGCRSTAHWLSWKCAMSLGTARTHVRVARALEELPVVADAFAAGELSFSKVRALTRLPQPFDEAEMVETARWATASQLDRLVAGCRQALNDDPSVAAGSGVERFRSRGRSDGSVAITLIVSAVDAERIDGTIAAACDRSLAERTDGVAVTDWVEHLGGWDEIRARAATDLLTNTINHQGTEPTQLVAEIEAEDDGVSGQCATSGRYLPNEVIRRLGCDAVVATITGNPDDGRGGGVGLSQRTVPHWLRRQLERRDHHTCRFPGCASSRRLHAHHIIHWLDHGPTEIDNLLLLCSFHHHLIHEGGWTLSGNANHHQFKRPDGTPATIPALTGNPASLPAARANARHRGGEDRGEPASLTAKWDGQPLDLHYAVAAITNTNIHSTTVNKPHEPALQPADSHTNPTVPRDRPEVTGPEQAGHT